MSALSEISKGQRLTIEDIDRHVEEIRRVAIDMDDSEAAHLLEDELAWTIVERLARRGSRIAQAALKARRIQYPRRCS